MFPKFCKTCGAMLDDEYFFYHMLSHLNDRVEIELVEPLSDLDLYCDSITDDQFCCYCLSVVETADAVDHLLYHISEGTTNSIVVCPLCDKSFTVTQFPEHASFSH